MDEADVPTRLGVLETTVHSHGERLTSHGRELDAVSREVAEMRVHDQHRDESMRRMETKIDQQAGKLDALRQDVLAKPADRWDRVVQLVITLVVSALIGLALARAGIVR